LVSSGTEAAMAALRLARAATGRQAILKFIGCYHGHVDALLVRAGSGALTLGVPDSPGVPPSLAELTLLAEFNDTGGRRALMPSRGGGIAAVIVEPVAGTMGVVPPDPGFLEALREETARAGALLIFDEVITGFRLGWGGAQGRYGIAPDLTCLGKIVGGGMPLAAYGGRRDLMQMSAPAGPVYQAGTLSGNPVSVAAGRATLEALRRDTGAYDRLEALGARAEAGLRAALGAAGRRGCVNRVGSMLTLFLGVEQVRDFPSASRADVEAFAGFFRGMLAEGIYLPPSQFEAVLLSLAHTEADIDRLVGAAQKVLAGRCAGPVVHRDALCPRHVHRLRVHGYHRCGSSPRLVRRRALRDHALGSDHPHRRRGRGRVRAAHPDAAPVPAARRWLLASPGCRYGTGRSWASSRVWRRSGAGIGSGVWSWGVGRSVSRSSSTPRASRSSCAARAGVWRSGFCLLSSQPSWGSAGSSSRRRRSCGRTRWDSWWG